MSAEILVSRFRSFLLVTAGLCCVASVLELWLEEHTGSLPQSIPFYLCRLGAAAIVFALIRPQRVTLKLLRYVMGAMLVGSLFGLIEHVEHNWEFAREIRPNATFQVLISDTLHGANPLLAPGILALAAALAIAATYYHPSLTGKKAAD